MSGIQKTNSWSARPVTLPVLAFLPETDAAKVCRAWRSSLHELLAHYWNTFPDRSYSKLKLKMATIAPSIALQEFGKLCKSLFEELRALDSRAARRIYKKFSGSLCWRRLLEMDQEIHRHQASLNPRLLFLEAPSGNSPNVERRRASVERLRGSIFEFCPEVALARVNKNIKNLLYQELPRWWKRIETLGIFSSRAEMSEKLTFSSLFCQASAHLAKDLASIDTTCLFRICSQFKSSLSPQRIVVLHKKIIHRRSLLRIWHQAAHCVKEIPIIDKDANRVYCEFRKKKNGKFLDRVSYLALIGMELERVPRELIRLRKLESLDISHNKLTELPDFLRHLYCLQSIKMRGNPFRQENYISIARILADLPKLKLQACSINPQPLMLLVKQEIDQAYTLSIVWSKIKVVLPTSLQENLSPSRIRERLLDPSLDSYWDRVPDLNLSNCGLRELPAEIFASLRNLTHLDLSENFLGALPYDAMEQLEHLKSLNLSHNGFLPRDYSNIADRLSDFPELIEVIHESPDFQFKTILTMKKSSSMKEGAMAPEPSGTEKNSKTCAIL